LAVRGKLKRYIDVMDSNECGGSGSEPVQVWIRISFGKIRILKSRVVDPDPDSMTLWIRIRIGNPDPGSGGKKIKKNKYFFS
jgi:hypothetical protein